MGEKDLTPAEVIDAAIEALDNLQKLLPALEILDPTFVQKIEVLLVKVEAGLKTAQTVLSLKEA